MLRRSAVDREERDFGRFLDLAACDGEPREAVLAEVERLVERGERLGIALRRADGGYALTVEVGWYFAVTTSAT